MTKRRHPLSFELALTKIAGTIGWAQAASIVGQAERTIRNWSDPDTSAGITLEAACRLDAAYRAGGGEDAPLLQCYRTRLDAAAAAACPDARAIALSVAVAAKEGGEAISAATLAALPGASDAQLAAAELEVEEAVNAHTVTLARLRARRRGDAPASAPEVALAGNDAGGRGL